MAIHPNIIVPTRTKTNTLLIPSSPFLKVYLKYNLFIKPAIINKKQKTPTGVTKTFNPTDRHLRESVRLNVLVLLSTIIFVYRKH
jgi:hypothetical protein